ncbi:hypothetical protein VTO73DRAFT_5089 [Trametes versicolor]
MADRGSSEAGVPQQAWEIPVKIPEGKVAVFATLVDGSVFEIPWRQAWDLPFCDINVLSIAPPFDVEGDSVQQILNRSMPALERLHVHGSSHGSSAIPETASCTLRGVNFPRLYDLQMWDVLIHLEAALCANLRCLRLATAHRRMAIVDFLTIVSQCLSLEVLDVDRYIDAHPAHCDPVPLLLSLDDHHSLRTVKTSDQPWRLAAIFSRLIVPAHVSAVEAVSLVSGDCASGLRAMIPSDRHNMLAMRRAISLQVYDTMELGTGISAIGSNGCRTTLKVIPGDDRPSWALKKRRGGSLFLSLVQCLDLFEGAAVKRIEFCGTLLGVPKAAWIATLTLFPGIQEVTLKDIPYPADHSFDTFILALAAPSNALPGPG